MDPQAEVSRTDTSQEPRHAGRPQPPSPSRGRANMTSRMGLAIISMAFIFFLVNIVAYLSDAFGQIGAAIVVAAVCLTILGVNVAFNFDPLRPRA